MNSLTLARTELHDQAAALEVANPREARLLEQLDPVLDYVARIAGQPNAHYRADKAGALLLAAVAVYGDCFAAYAGDSPVRVEAVNGVAHELRRVVSKLDAMFWALAAGDPPPSWRLDEVSAASTLLAAVVTAHVGDIPAPPPVWSCVEDSVHPDDQCATCRAGAPEDCDVYGTEEVY